MSQDPPDVERLRTAFSSFGTAHPRQDCPDPGQIWEARQGRRSQLSEEERHSIIDHVSSCEVCAEAWSLAGELEQTQPAADSKIIRGRFKWFSNRSLLAAAATLVLLVSAVFMGRLFVDPGFREVPGERIESRVAGLTPLPRDRCLLRWTPGPEGSSYHLRVTSEDLELIIASMDLREPEYLVPVESLQDLPSGGRILWQIEARTPGGETLRSTTFVNEVN